MLKIFRTLLPHNDRRVIQLDVAVADAQGEAFGQVGAGGELFGAGAYPVHKCVFYAAGQYAPAGVAWLEFDLAGDVFGVAFLQHDADQHRVKAGAVGSPLAGPRLRSDSLRQSASPARARPRTTWRGLDAYSLSAGRAGRRRMHSEYRSSSAGR